MWRLPLPRFAAGHSVSVLISKSSVFNTAFLTSLHKKPSTQSFTAYRELFPIAHSNEWCYLLCVLFSWLMTHIIRATYPFWKQKLKNPPKPTTLSVLYSQGPNCRASTVNFCNYFLYRVHKVNPLSVSSTPLSDHICPVPTGPGTPRHTSVMTGGSLRLSIQLTHGGAWLFPFVCKQVLTPMLSAPFRPSSILPLATAFKSGRLFQGSESADLTAGAFCCQSQVPLAEVQVQNKDTHFT